MSGIQHASDVLCRNVESRSNFYTPGVLLWVKSIREYLCHCYSCYKPVSVPHVSPVALLLLQTCLCSTRVTFSVTLATNMFLFQTCHLSCYSCYKPVSVPHVSPVVLLLLQTCFCSTRVTCRVTLVTNLFLFLTCPGTETGL
jgi:hypothetical protein